MALFGFFYVYVWGKSNYQIEVICIFLTAILGTRFVAITVQSSIQISNVDDKLESAVKELDKAEIAVKDVLDEIQGKVTSLKTVIGNLHDRVEAQQRWKQQFRQRNIQAENYHKEIETHTQELKFKIEELGKVNYFTQFLNFEFQLL